VDVRVAQRLDYPVIELPIDRAKAAYAGIDAEQVMKDMVTATNSSIGFDPAFWIDERNGNHYFIGAQYPEEDLVSLDTMLDVPVGGTNGSPPVPLRNLVTLKRTTGPSVVNHHNITRVIDVYANVRPETDIGSVVAGIEERLAASGELKPRPRESDRGTYFDVTGPDFAGAGYSFILTGEVALMREMIEQFGFGLGLALVLIYLVLVVQFRSFSDPLIILLAVPLGLIGVAVMLRVTGTALSIMSSMGIIMMTGMVVAYSVLLVDYANRLRDEGADVREAVARAAGVRLRPILMTSLSTVLALVPMAIGGRGGEANAPLARAIIGGVLGAVVLSLVVVPCLYTLLARPRASARPALVEPA